MTMMEDTKSVSPGVQSAIEQGEKAQAEQLAHRAMMRHKKFDTIAVHGMYSMNEALRNQGSIIEPAFLSPAQHFATSDQMEAALAYLTPSWTYSRIANPTLSYLEETLALLEGYGFAGETSACLTSSGMSAIFLATNAFLTLEAGKQMNIVASAKCYGGTFMLFNRYASERGVEVRWIHDELNLREWEAAIDEETRFVYGEMPANPSLALFDLEAVAQLAHQANVPLLVDSTVATPALLRPLLFGADIVIHSVSKSMASSGFAIAGVVVARHNLVSRVGSDDLRANFAMHLKLLPGRDYGPALAPLQALLIINDLRTLRSKVDQMSQNAMRVAQYLQQHASVQMVSYPGLSDQPAYSLAQRYLQLVDSELPVGRYGSLLSFRMQDAASARSVFDRLEMIWRATDLGRMKSVATIPAISTHQQQGEEGRSLADIPANLIRLSVGVEHADDIIADLEQAFA